MATECQGTWRHSREIGESEPTISVSRCDGCGEQLAIFKYRGTDFPKEATDHDILTKLLSR